MLRIRGARRRVPPRARRGLTLAAPGRSPAAPEASPAPYAVRLPPDLETALLYGDSVSPWRRASAAASIFGGAVADGIRSLLSAAGRPPPGFGRWFPDPPAAGDGSKAAGGGGREKGRSPSGPPGKQPGGDPEQQQPSVPPAGVAVLGVVGSLLLLNSFSKGKTGREVSFQEFVREHLYKGDVRSVEVQNKAEAIVNLTGSSERLLINIPSVDAFESNMREAQRDLGIAPADFIPISYETHVSVLSEVVAWAPALLMLGLGFALYRAASQRMGGLGGGSGGGGGARDIFSVGKAKPTVTRGEAVKTTFADVAGLDEAKTEITEFVSFLKHPKRFTRIGAKLPKGAMLVGPPGTGKTLLARATAGEAGVPFFSISGSDFLEMFVGVGPARVRDLFEQARAAAPSIVFIDEIDAVARKRGKGGFGGSNDERESTLNQLLVSLDGFTAQESVVVLAGTNRVDVLDPALLRAGRFDRQIQVDLPDIKGRRAIFAVHLKGLRLALPRDDVAQRLSALTPGFSGASIQGLCNEAALIAARGGKKRIELVDFEAAADRVIGGIATGKTMSLEERKLVAYHEAGHAVCGWFLEHADPMLKVTILPRGQSLGYAQYLPQELNLYRKDNILHKMQMALGGRASEQVFFGRVSTGALDDLRRVTQMAYGLVRDYGMDERVGNMSFDMQQEGQFTKPYSEATAEMIDQEASALVRSAYEETLALVEKHRGTVERLAERLLKDETINHDVLVEVMGEREFGSPAYDEYVRNKPTAGERGKEGKGAEEGGGKNGGDVAPELAVR